MDHPTIITAFKNASDRGSAEIYLVFKRENQYYKDTYYILLGNKTKAEKAIIHAYKEVAKEKRNYSRADHNNMLDTPFDTWCCGACICNDLQRCSDDQDIKCGSQWTHIEHKSEEELNNYISTIRPGYYPQYTVEYM
uniref:Uncharacterized protein n=1 Tax=viral metagenome TaxID=1070528 RepID=A0A6C0IJN0_9ZZZZ